MDDSANVEETRDYYPFGLPMPGRYEKGSPSTQEDFTGHVKDNSTQLHYAGARYYSGAFGRWLKPDPILGEKGAKKLLKQDERLLTMTSYNYAFDRPTLLVDPDGRMPCPPCSPIEKAMNQGRQLWQQTVGKVANAGQTGDDCGCCSKNERDYSRGYRNSC
jgi:RHS repeat-associated protein